MDTMGFPLNKRELMLLKYQQQRLLNTVYLDMLELLLEWLDAISFILSEP